MKPLLTLCLLMLATLCQAQQPFSISFELSDGINRDTVTVGYDPLSTHLIDPQLGERDITGTPRKVVDIRAFAASVNCIFDSTFNGFSGLNYETKSDFKPGFTGITTRFQVGRPFYGWTVQAFDSNTFYFNLKMPNRACTLSILNQLSLFNYNRYEMYMYSVQNGMNICQAFNVRIMTGNFFPGSSLWQFNLNPFRVDTNVVIAFTRYNQTTSLPKSLSAAGLKLRNHTLTATTAIKPDRIEVVDYLGRLQHQGHWSADQPDYELPVREGIWFLRLYYGGQATVVKVYVAA